jgi:serine/threonine protein kinase
MESDLETILKAKDEIPDIPMSHIKKYLEMLLKGVQELHSHNILHRDLKPNNLLFCKRKIAKICDFGMATLNGKTTKSLQVVTRAYRAPELFFGETNYGFGVDMWSVGCIFAEMLKREPVFDGTSDIDHLSRVFKVLGSPKEAGWEVSGSVFGISECQFESSDGLVFLSIGRDAATFLSQF